MAGGVVIPDVAVHYHLADRPPFLNLSDVPEDEIDAVLVDLAAEHADGRNHRRFGRLYMDLRKETERRLRDAFVAAGGIIERDAPHYFTLGDSPWFRRLAPSMVAVEIALADLPDESTSITWWDSFAAMAVGEDLGLPVAPEGVRGRVHRLGDIPALLDRFGSPDPGGEGPSDPMSAAHTFVEVQVWSDAPLALGRPFRV